ncbi:alpha-L-fucosidase [Pedobacter frigiditerrae]|uniref:alpha-L-fucosidase n=1 Tax=Pedobacter frigiditerrae TaxID=2530452 RepID=A0A4R0N0X2_9SPHI|nr:alpha-L-fucosidase [Pedobacter frigiditerrae]TCC93381.1 alpha-L-fucosidase [Pedobacter frigiditerrae]
MNRIIIIFCLVFISFLAVSQTYKAPTDEKVAAKLSQWGDKKFGLFMHWGIYSIPGIVESWSINSEDASWIPRDSTKNYEEYKKWYFDLNKQFNPVNFDPTIWASYAKKAGMQYVVFTTKHHDGFAMFDTKQSDYKITGRDVPFATNAKANITKEVFSAFRKEGFMIGAYFSKPDWHNENYWWPRYATPDRNNNYDIRLHPQRWDNFKKFTYNQIEELMSDYGSVDILWLDGGWVRPKATVNEEVLSWGAPIPAWDQDINMPNIANMARRKQPGLIMVDRTVHGEYENYQTPEQKIPEKPLNYPWETCMTMGDAWGYVPNDNYKSTNTLIHLLVDIVAKGGNFLLDVGPKPDGTFPEPVLQRLTEVGNWMAINKEAIYSTQPIAPYKTENVCFTKSKNGNIYALYLIDDKNVASSKVTIKSPPKMPKKLTLLGLKSNLKWKQIGNNLEIILPTGVKDLKHTLVFKMD